VEVRVWWIGGDRRGVRFWDGGGFDYNGRVRGTRRTDGGGRVFRYPLGYRILSLVGSVFLGTCTVLALGPGPGIAAILRWPVVVFGLCAALNAWLLWALLPRIETDAEGIALTRLGHKRRLRWRDVRAIEHRPGSASLVIRGPSAVLRVHRQLRRYLEFYKILTAAVPGEALEQPLRIPFTVAASPTLRLVLAGTLVLSGWLGLALLGSGSRPAALVMFGLAALSLYVGLYRAPVRFEFDRDGLKTVYLLREARRRAAELQAIELVQRRAVTVLRLKFRGKTVSLSDSQVRVPPERIYESLLGAYPVQKG